MNRADIVTGMARAAFACAWADWQEQYGDENLSGVEITDVMPQGLDPAALPWAEKLAATLDAKCGEPVETFAARHPGGLDAETWGHYAAMEAMGHGVGLRGDYDVPTPYVHAEFSYFDLDADRYPIPEES